ncbi:MAG: hypothetical protein VX899_23405 [Myxococcota bacterium]|nr:hypothetical protein [Myxococcota bacterium]
MLPENPSDKALAFVDYCKTPGHENHFAVACFVLNADAPGREEALVQLADSWGFPLETVDAEALVESFDEERAESGIRPDMAS